MIEWTVGAGGSRLIGYVTAHEEVEGRHQFEAWVALIGAKPEPEYSTLGQVRLRAFVKDFEGGLVMVGIVAELDEQEAEG